MKKQTFTITFLSMTALVLLLANYMTAPQALAGAVIKDRNYQAATALTTQGEDGIYVLDNQSGMLMFFAYDAGRRMVSLRATRPVSTLFAAVAPPAPVAPHY